MSTISDPNLITIFLSGDVMTGRGIDQILPYPCAPQIFEPFMKDARGYVHLAENVNGPVPRGASFSYIWGDALSVFATVPHDLRIINLETSITRSEEYWHGKGINYRMCPDNVGALTVAGINCCALANNHILDWGYRGLADTLTVLDQAHVAHAGAGSGRGQAQAPAELEIAGKGRVILFSCGTLTSGIPLEWEAGEALAGVWLLQDLSSETVRGIRERVSAVKRPGDVVILSLHWGGNWGYALSAAEVEFAHRLVTEAGVDVLHGHSSHHVKAIEVYHGRPIIYGCGDLINDYEGIHGYQGFRGDLALMYFVKVDPATGCLVRLEMRPMQMKKLRLIRATHGDALWLRETLNREGTRLGTGVMLEDDGTLVLRWAENRT